MSEKQFRVRFEQEDGRGEIVNEKGVELTTREAVDCLNKQQSKIKELEKENEQLKSRVDFLEDMCLDILIILTKDDKLIVKK